MIVTFERVLETLQGSFKMYNGPFQDSCHIYEYENYGHTEGLEVKINKSEQTMELWQYLGSGYDPYMKKITDDLEIIYKIVMCMEPNNGSRDVH